jgi:hypothetical protein
MRQPCGQWHYLYHEKSERLSPAVHSKSCKTVACKVKTYSICFKKIKQNKK